VQANVELVVNKLYAMDRASGSGSPSSGDHQTESHSPRLFGSARASGFARSTHLSRASGDVDARLAALEDKMDTLIKLVSERK
jgi:hypothetical protein